MKKLLLASAALCALTAMHDAALAADMPVKAPIYKAAPPTIYNWTGCYLGVHGGGGVIDDTFVFIRGGGGLAGGQLGCNYQAGAAVVGIEGEGWWSGLSSQFNDGFERDVTRNRRDADVALRAGLAVDRVLAYVKVGAAWGRFDVSFDDLNRNRDRANGSLVGGLLGIGLEYAFFGNWSAKIEYNYINYVGREFTHQFTNGATNLTSSFDETFAATKHIAKLGLNYKFGDWPSPIDAPTNVPIYKAPPAIYSWTGCYVGLHGGGGVLFDSFVLANGGGGLAGGQAGCNYQNGTLVTGVEVEGQWSDITSGFTTADDNPNTLDRTVRARHRWGADVALRAGVAVDRVLFYHKVGAAVGRFDFAYDDSDGLFRRGSSDLYGLLLGTGVEYAFAAGLSAKLEYNYIGYLGRSVHFDAGPAALGPNGFPFDTTTSATTHVVKAGLNYKFGDAAMAAARPIAALPPAAYDWTGCYMGVHAGGGVLNDDWTTKRNGGNPLGGGQLGCNVQSGRAVIGIEAEGWSGLENRSDFNRPLEPDDQSHVRSRNLWDVDVAVRAGLAVDRTLAYAKIGGAWGWFDFASEFPANPLSNRRTDRALFSGVLLGTGLEYAFATNWTAKLEYDYIGYLARNVRILFASGDTAEDTISAEKHIVKFGVNYKFGGPAVVAKY